MLLQLTDALGDVFHPKRHMLNPFAALLDNFRHRALCRQRLKRLQFRLSRLQKRHFHLLRLDFLDAEKRQAEHICIKRKRFLNRADGDADMVDFFHVHRLQPLCRKMMRPTFYYSPFRQKILLFLFFFVCATVKPWSGSFHLSSCFFPCPLRCLPLQ